MTQETIQQTFTPNLPEPFLGRIVLELLNEDVNSYLRKLYGMQDSKLVLPDSMEEKKRVPVKKGKILRMACDAFGEAFKNRYGNDFAQLKSGDTVWFIPNETYKLDTENKYAIISDQDVIAFERG